LELSKAVVLNRVARLPRGPSIDIKWGASPYALCNREGLINKYICLYNLFVIKWAWNKGQLHKEGVADKRWRTTDLKNIRSHWWFCVLVDWCQTLQTYDD